VLISSLIRNCFLTVLIAGGASAIAQSGRSPGTIPDIGGVYQPIPTASTLSGGLKNAGTLADLPLLPAAVQQMKAVNLKEDPAKMCQPLGPFRMMGRQDAKIELLPENGMIVMLFEDLERGVVRIVYTKRGHKEKLEPTWMGDSVGRWEGDTLIVDTVGFNDITWLNDAGARHSESLHLVERIRPVLAGKYLEYKMTAEDPKVLAKPYTYTRYFEKLKTEIMEDVCVDEE
jgi:hypothetical protein